MIRESGPPHMKTFVTRCTVGDLVAEGHGSGKKLSKKDAALKMLDLLRQEDGQLPVTVSCYKKTNNKNTKNRRKQAIKVKSRRTYSTQKHKQRALTDCHKLNLEIDIATISLFY